MDVFNLFGEHDWDGENDLPGYRHRTTVIGKRLGATPPGGSLYELPPGEKTWPYHYEIGCEEWLIAVSGRQAADVPCSASRPMTAWATTTKTKARGVEFEGEPEAQPFGTDVLMRDHYGNRIYMNQD